MKTFFGNMKRILSGENTNLRQRMFYIISIVGLVLSVFGIIESAMITEAEMIGISLAAMLACIFISYFLEMKFGFLDGASLLVGFGMCVIAFPNMFFLNGGVEGGATLYLCLNIIYVSLLFEGPLMLILFGFFVILDASVYWVAYNFPYLIMPLESEEAILLDSMYSVIAVGLAVAVMVQLHIRAFASQREQVVLQKAELEENAKSKNKFFASMSHEVRSPINTILGLNEMIIRENKAPEINEYASSVKDAGKMLLSLINDILDISQMDMGKMEIVPTVYNTTELLTELTDMMSVQLTQKKLEFILDIDQELPSKMYGDKKRIQQVLINLLTNAVKYTSEGSVTLSVRVEEKNSDVVKLKMAVSDTGIGIRKEDMESLFDLFKRVDLERNSNIEGSGLGLPLTNQLVELMNGELKVDSIYTKGSTFTVLLTQEIIDVKSIGKSGESWIPSRHAQESYQQLFEAPEARILVVDDLPTNVTIIEKLLSKTLVQIDKAYSGQEALMRTKEKYYHLILLDHQMPEMDGIETVAEIRKQDNGLCRQSPVIALTANLFSGAEQFYREKGFDSYLEKPVDGILLEKMIVSYLPAEIVEKHSAAHSLEDTTYRSVHTIRKKRVKITTDCVADLSNEQLRKYDIGLMYLYIKTEKGRFADTIEIDSSNLPQYLKEDTLLATADGVSVEEFEQFYAEQLSGAEEIIHISMASDSGKSYGVAVAAAQSFGHVHVIDSKQISCGQSLLVMYAAKLAQEDNLSVEQLISQIEEIRGHIKTQFMVPSADYFYKTGYTSKRMAMLCKVLQLRPILKMKGSRIDVAGFCTGDIHAARRKFIARSMRRKKRIDPEIVYISQVVLGVKEQEMVKNEILRQLPFKKVYLQKASFSCACNAGPEAVGFAYYQK